MIFDSNLQYKIRNPRGEINKQVFELILSKLEQFNGVGVEKENENSAYIFYSFNQNKPHLELLDNNQVLLEVFKTDLDSIGIIRDVAADLNLQVFSEQTQVVLSKDSFLVETQTISGNEEEIMILNKLGYTSIFNYLKTKMHFAIKKGENQVYMFNENMLEYFLNGAKIKNHNEESTVVAETLNGFVARFDAGLIKLSFYANYENKSKIVNYSNIELNKPKRKIFVKPYIFELNSEWYDFHIINSEKGSLIYADQILPNEDFEETLNRILEKELNLGAELIGAAVMPKVEFDYDKHKNLTPRVLVKVYIRKI